MSDAEPTIGPELPEQVEQIRAALPDGDRARFEQDLDQALNLARSTRDLRPLSQVVEAGGGWCSRASMAAAGGRRPRRGCAVARSPSGRVNPWTWRTRSAATSPELFTKSVRPRCRSDPVSCSAPYAYECPTYRFLYQHLQLQYGLATA